MSEKPKQPSEWKQRRTIGFTSPFNLRTCQQRLQKKLLGERRMWKSNFILSKVNDEAHEVYITRGLSVVDGRLDMLTEKSTLVSLTARINWLLLLGIFAVVEVIFSPLLAIMGANVVSHLMGWGTFDISDMTRVQFTSSLGFSIMVVLALSIVSLLITLWRARHSCASLLYTVETVLTDPIPNIPDLSVLDMDGQIVFKQFEQKSTQESDSLTPLLEIDAKHERKA